MKTCLALLSLCILLLSCSAEKPASILIPQGADALEHLAAKEVRRYLYARTGELLPIQETVSLPSRGKAILIVSSNSSLAGDVTQQFKESISNEVEAQEYHIKTITQEPLTLLTIYGGDPAGALYGAYRFLEEYGIRFYVHGDVIPEKEMTFKLPTVDIHGKPQFELRGIQPFHDFPEGPDWWNLDDYKAVIAQLAKMRMNFLGFHTYPSAPFNGHSKPEPMVWHGTTDQLNADGTVKAAYPVMHFNTGDSTWGYFPKPASEFKFGAARLFDTDQFGAEYMKNVSKWPHTEQENIEIFQEFGKWQKDAFTFAQRLGVKTCIGTETPLIIPYPLKAHLREQGINPATDRATRLVYEGTFERFKRLFPLDYYWFWTPEYWTWQDVPDADVERTLNDILLAYEAAENVNAPFTLATCGWVLGPPKDRAQFDRELPKEMPFSCINRQVGFTPVDSNFVRLTDRPAWAISWLEDDPALISPQLWVGRVRRDAVDAFRYGCSGFMGIHWRTQILSPMFAALAQSGWRFGDWQDAGSPNTRDLPVDDFYTDWARANFGKEAGDQLAPIFAKLDGGPLFIPGENERQANLYRTSDWAGRGPGGLKIIEEPWSEVKKNFEFIHQMEAAESFIQRKGNRQRYYYWLNTFRFARASAEVGCLLGELQTLVNNAAAETDSEQQKQLIREQVLPLKARAEKAWGNMVTLLLSTVSTTGDLGTLSNLEQHNLSNLQRLTQHDSLLTAILQEPLPEPAFWMEYRGPKRLIVPTKRSILESDEDLQVRALLLSPEEEHQMTLYWRPLGESSFQTKSFEHVARHVYQTTLPASDFGNADFEYYILAKSGDTELKFPVTAPALNQSVVVW